MKKLLLPILGVVWFIFTFLFTTNIVFAQQNGVTRCATMKNDAKLRANNPNLGTLDDMEQMLAPIIRQKKEGNPNVRIVNGVYIIPVIVHIIHNGEAIGVGSNISYARIQSQIETLNDDFRRRAGTNGFNTHPNGADTKIEFRLAQRKPDGTGFGAEIGVNRINRTVQGWNPDANGNYDISFIDGTIKPYTTVTQNYDGSVYMSYWCIPGIKDGSNTGILGYAQFPTTTLSGLSCATQSTTTDGVVMATGTVGGETTPSTSAPYNLGRTATHEIGHWLSLRHIWGDGGCGVDDFCADTPTAGTPNFGCPTTNSCTDTPVDAPDMVENYMDYTNDACMNIFTNDQKIRMRTVLETTRFSLINSVASVPPNPSDAGVLAVLAPIADVCSSTVTPVVRIKNYGSTNLTSVTVEYRIDGASFTSQTFTGLNIAPNGTVELILNNITGVALGVHTFEAKTILPNGVADPFTDSDLSNSTFTLGNGVLPILVDFEGADFPPASWERQNLGNDCNLWVADASPTLRGLSGTRTKAAVMKHFGYTGTGQEDILVSPYINLTGAGIADANLEFDLAYRQRNGGTNETLRIDVSTDCGATWVATPIYTKTGATLATVGNSTIAFIPTSTAQWRREVVSLNAYLGQSIKVRFVTVNANGNNLYIDNIKIYDTRPNVGLTVATNTGSEAATSAITVTATASTAVIGDQTVNLAVTGTGITTGDYNLSNSTITILNGQTTGTVTFTVVDDALIEGSETATLTISSPSAGIVLGSPISQDIVIADNDAPAVNLSVSSNASSEAAPSAITVTATASAAVIGDQTVNLAVTGTGITAGDYTLSNSTITILDGQTTGTATFTVVDDALPEGTETAILTISSPSAGIVLGLPVSQNIVITDNDDNDICTDAATITCGTTYTGSTVGKGNDTPATCTTISGTGGGVWYKIAGNNQQITVSTCGAGTNFDTKLRVYSGSCAALTCVTGNDDACATQSTVNFDALVGTDYFILLHGYNASEGNYEMSVSCVPLPVQAAFTSNQAVTYVNTDVVFTDASIAANAWAWNFGAGANTATATTVGLHTISYSTVGVKTITLNINGGTTGTFTTTRTIIVLPNRPTPYTIADGGNFEVNTSDFAAQNITGTNWVRGNSTTAGKNGVVSGANAWVTGLTGDYANNSNSNLYTPNFNFSAAGTYNLSFQTKHNFETGWDGMIVEYSTDKGANWLKLGAATTGAIWYNSTSSGTLFGSSVPTMSNIVSDYTTKSLDISNLAGNTDVAFRVAFRSDGSGQRVGAAIDDFVISFTPIANPSVNLSVNANIGSEAAASSITVTATASAAVVGDQTVNLAVTGTGITAADYTLSNSTITILNGQTTGSVTFTVVDDALVEGTETATLTISSPSAGIVLGTPVTQNIVITDNDNYTIAVTEFINNPIGSEATDEWIELYNYGANPVNIQNWRLKDEDSDDAVITNSSYSIAAGEYLVLAKDKSAFEAQWLGSVANTKVIQVSGLTLANGADEIVIEDNSNNIVWSLAYADDETDGIATFYSESTYTTNIWGSKAAPGINRNGNDVTSGSLAYESNNNTNDMFARTSTTGDSGSPLNLTPIAPEINVAGNGITIPSGSTTTNVNNNTAFGQTVGTPISKTFAIQNIGTSALNVSTITSSNPAFSFENVPTSFIVNDQRMFQIVFAPTVLGVQTSTITINSNDADEAAYTFNVSGEAVCPTTQDIFASTTFVLPNQFGSIGVNSKLGVTYQLQNVTAGNTDVGNPIAGTGGVIYLPTNQLTTTTSFRVIANRGLNCGNVTSNTVTITVSGSVTGYGYQQTELNTCSSTSTIADITVTLPGSNFLWDDTNTTTTQNLSNVENGIYSVDIDNGTTLLPVIVGSPVLWEKPIRATLTNEGRIVANGIYDWNLNEAAATSKSKLESNENGGFTFIVEDMTTIEHVSIGFATPNEVSSYLSIDNSFYVESNGDLSIYLNDVNFYLDVEGITVSVGDRLTITREGTSINYYYNAELVYVDVEARNATDELVVDIALVEGTSPQVWFSKCNANSFEVNYVQTTEDACNTPTGEGAITLLPQKGGVAPYSYVWANGATAVANPTGMSTGLTSVEVTDNEGYKKVLPVIIGNPVNWTDLQNVSSVRGKLFTSGFVSTYSNSGAISQIGMGATTDGGITYVYSSAVSNYVIGLSPSNTNPSWSSILYGVYIYNGTMLVYQSGVVMARLEGIEDQDRISVIRKGNQIIFYQNSTEVHRMASTTADLFVDVTLESGQTPVIYASWCTTVASDLVLTYSQTAVDDCTTLGTNEGAVTLQGEGGLSAYMYSWTDAGTENPRTGVARGLYDVILTSGMRTIISPVVVGGFANWGNLTTNTTQIAGTITSSVSTDFTTPEGGLSTNRLAASTDGGISFIVPNTTDLSNFQIGLSSTTAIGSDWESMGYSVWINGENSILIYESGVYVGATQSVIAGDRISIIRKAGNVEYYINSKRVRITTVGGITQELAADISIIAGTSPTVYTSFCNTGFRIANKTKATDSISETTLDATLEEDQFAIYPNPSTGIFNVRFATQLTANTEVTIFDGIGRAIKTQTFEKGNQKFSIDLNNQPKGVYLIRFNQNGATYSKSIVIE